MIDVFTDDMKFEKIEHTGANSVKQQIVRFIDKDGNVISIALSLKEFEKLYHACVGRAETLDSFEPWRNGWYKLKEEI